MKKWNSFKDFFKELNKQKYIILRNHKTMMEDIFMGGDIDILCENKEYLAKQIYALPRSTREIIFNYYIIIGDKKVPIDIREIGDGYYDSLWEKNMLVQRVKTDEYYILDDENYRYSLLYHAMLHKPFISGKYIKILEDMFREKIGNNENTDKLLCSYMYKKEYSIARPLDKGVSFNYKNYERLHKILKSFKETYYKYR